jgi:hypothetical protein
MKNIFKQLKTYAILVFVLVSLVGLSTKNVEGAVTNDNWYKFGVGSLATNTGNGLANANIHVAGCYIGMTTSTPCGGGGTIAGTIQATQVAFGSALDTIAGSNLFTWNNTTGKLALRSSTADFALEIHRGVANPDGGIMAIGTHGAGQALNIAGAGTRMFWYPAKSAFRAGEVTGNEWNDANVGDHSVAFGLDTTASGDQSLAIGRGTSATGNFGATALGANTTASSDSAFAFGSGTSATGNTSTAFGNSTLASGANSTAFGVTTQATNNSSVAFGNTTFATGTASTSFGQLTQATGDFSTAFGNTTLAQGNYSTAFGADTSATGNTSTAFGEQTVASGIFSTAFGELNTADGYASTAFGSANNAFADYSTAFGQNFDIGVGATNSVGIGLDNSGYTLNQANTMSIMGGNFGLNVINPSLFEAYGSNNSVRLQVDDGAIGRIDLDIPNGTSRIGDINALGNSTLVTVDDPLQNINIFGSISLDAMTVDSAGGNVIMPFGNRGLYYDPASLVATAQITLPPNPNDGQEILIIFGGTITSGPVITAFTLAVPSTETIVGTVPATATVDTNLALKYRLANDTWYVVND